MSLSSGKKYFCQDIFKACIINNHFVLVQKDEDKKQKSLKLNKIWKTVTNQFVLKEFTKIILPRVFCVAFIQNSTKVKKWI